LNIFGNAPDIFSERAKNGGVQGEENFLPASQWVLPAACGGGQLVQISLFGFVD